MEWLFRIGIAAACGLVALFLVYGVPAIIEHDKRQRAEWAAYVEQNHCKIIHTEDSRMEYVYGFNAMSGKMGYYWHTTPSFKIWQCDGGVTHKR